MLTGASAGRVDETAAGGVDAPVWELVAQGQSSGAPSSPSFDADDGPSWDHLIRPLQERWQDREAGGLGGLEVDYQLELLRGLRGITP